ncbi:hypothetical protein ACQY0O_003321 [Thecaphora frezii]|nr:putative alport syndrome [Thecaphora frezii]
MSPSGRSDSTGASVSVALAEHCYFCFQVILAELRGEPEPEQLPFPDAGQEYPLFVTWNIHATDSLTGTPRLRGCIGTFEPYPLATGLSEYAAISAFKDGRFAPIALREVPRLECGVSLLTGFEECQDYLDWDVGTHGIYIHLPNPVLAPRPTDETASSSSSSGSSTPAANGRSATPRRASSSHMLTATYLPDVIPDQGWTKQEAIDSAIRKAGYNGKITEPIRRSLRVRRYRSEKVARHYAHFVQWQQQQQQQ